MANAMSQHQARSRTVHLQYDSFGCRISNLVSRVVGFATLFPNPAEIYTTITRNVAQKRDGRWQYLEISTHSFAAKNWR
jgi:hypothetical protein